MILPIVQNKGFLNELSTSCEQDFFPLGVYSQSVMVYATSIYHQRKHYGTKHLDSARFSTFPQR